LWRSFIEKHLSADRDTDIDPSANGSNMFIGRSTQSYAYTLAFGSSTGRGAIPVISNEVFSRAAFDRIASTGFEALKKRFALASEALQGHDISPEEYATLDDAIASGARYNELIKSYLGLGSPPGAEESGGRIRSAISATRTIARTVGSYDEGEATIAHQLRKAGRVSDINVLNMITRTEWMDLFPTSANALVSLATQWILHKLEVESNAFARRNSDEQFRSAESTCRNRVENTFRGMFTSRFTKMKEEVNKAEVKAYPR
jgi:hypothetical protein